MATPRADTATNGAEGRLQALAGGLAGKSRYFKWRAAVIATWAVLSAASVAYAFTGGTENDLGAEVNVVDVGFGTALDIQNHSQAIWRNVTVVLQPGGFLYRQANLRPGDRMSLEVDQFARPGPHGRARHPRQGFMPRAVTIRTATASYTRRVHGPH